MSGKRILVDISPIRHNTAFRRLWSGYLVGTMGNQLTVVAVPYQVFRLTGSSLDVGLVSLAQFVPLLLGSFGGGALADAFDRRRVLIANQLLLALSGCLLALNAESHHPGLWLIFLASSFAAGVSGVDGPTRSALVVGLVERGELATANALWQLLYQIGQIVGPAAGGVLLGRFGLASIYWINAIACLVALGNIARLRTPARTVPVRDLSPRAFVAGLRFVLGHQVLQGVFVVDLVAMIFGMPRALFPALGLQHFHGSPSTVGFLFAAPAVGALLGAILTGWVARVVNQGRAVLIAVAAWGLAIAAFGLSPVLWLALVFLALAGAADVVSAVFRSTILQVETPRALLGRLQAVQTAVVTGGPRLGDLEAGSVASLAGVDFSVISGGVACIIGVIVLARLLPRFTRYVPAPFEHGPDEAVGTHVDGHADGSANGGDVEG